MAIFSQLSSHKSRLHVLSQCSVGCDQGEFWTIHHLEDSAGGQNNHQMATSQDDSSCHFMVVFVQTFFMRGSANEINWILMNCALYYCVKYAEWQDAALIQTNKGYSVQEGIAQLFMRIYNRGTMVIPYNNNCDSFRYKRHLSYL